MIAGFRTFLFRGNVIDLAVAVVVGAAFNAVITALVRDLVTPLVAAFFGKPDFSALTFTLNKSTFLYGDFINAIVSFVLVAAAIYFFVVAPMNAMLALREPAPEVEALVACPQCLSEIPARASRCKFCTAVVAT